jgi:hypothetical protein
MLAGPFWGNGVFNKIATEFQLAYYGWNVQNPGTLSVYPGHIQNYDLSTGPQFPPDVRILPLVVAQFFVLAGGLGASSRACEASSAGQGSVCLVNQLVNVAAHDAAQCAQFPFRIPDTWSCWWLRFC